MENIHQSQWQGATEELQGENMGVIKPLLCIIGWATSLMAKMQEDVLLTKRKLVLLFFGIIDS